MCLALKVGAACSNKVRAPGSNTGSATEQPRKGRLGRRHLGHPERPEAGPGAGQPVVVHLGAGPQPAGDLLARGDPRVRRDVYAADRRLALSWAVHGQHREPPGEPWISGPGHQDLPRGVHAAAGNQRRQRPRRPGRAVEPRGERSRAERDVNPLHNVPAVRGPGQVGRVLAVVELAGQGVVVPHRPAGQRPQLGGGVPVHRGGLRVPGLLGAACPLLPAQRDAAHYRNVVGELLDRVADDRHVGRGQLVADRAQMIGKPGLVELDRLSPDNLVDQPALLAEPARPAAHAPVLRSWKRIFPDVAITSPSGRGRLPRSRSSRVLYQEQSWPAPGTPGRSFFAQRKRP